MNFKITLTVLTLLIVFNVQAQYSSPYSQFGLGKIANPVTGGNAACGGISAGYISTIGINPQNPASYAHSYLTLFEAGGYMESGAYKSNDSSYASGNGAISHIAMLFPLKSNKWGLAFGLNPYSSVNLNFNSILEDQELKKISVANVNKGSLYKAYVGSGYKIKDFSFGANLGLIWGNIENTYSYYVQDSVGRSFDKSSNTSMRAFYYNVGMQYAKNINKTTFLVLGFSGASNTMASADRNQSVNTWQISNGSIISDKATRDTSSFSFLMPGYLDFGFSITKKNYITFGADIKAYNWSVMRYNVGNNLLNNSWTFHAGLEIKPIYREGAKPKKYLNSVIYRAGATFGKSEQNISNTAINTYSIHLGVGLPVKAPRILTYCNLGFEIGGRGMDNLYSNESYFKFNAFFTFADKWFGRTKFE